MARAARGPPDRISPNYAGVTRRTLVRQHLDAGEVAFSAANHEPRSVQQIGRFGRPVLSRDLLVVDRSAAFLDGAAGRTLALAQSAENQKIDDAGGLPRRDSLDWKPIILIIGGLAVLIAFIKFGIGFIPATAVLFAATSAAFGRRAFIVDLIIGFVVGIIIYLLFSKLLTLSLPMGPLERLI